MEKTKIPILKINKSDVYTTDYINKNNSKCDATQYPIPEYRKRYAVITSYEDLEKYLPDDQMIRDTGRYIMDYHKKGTYVEFKNGKLKYFLFLNKSSFIAPYNDKIKINPYIKVPPNAKFRLTNCLLRIIDEKQELKKIDFYIMEVLYFLKQFAENRTVPDCSFYFNHKDQILIHKIDGKYYNPYPDVFGKVPLEDEWQKCKLGKLFSICHAKDYEDISFVAPDDIIREFKLYSSDKEGNCVNPYYHENKLEIKWDDKKAIAFFRGTSTGCGNDIYTNQRMKLAFLDAKWNADKTKEQILDAKIVRWAYRLKKTEKEPMFNRINVKRLNKMGLDLGEKAPIEDLYKYKYVLNVDGNVSAYRLGFLFSLNAVVFIVEGKYKLWFQDKLVENKHYISVKADLSNLKEKIYWCKNHDDECKKIAQNALEFHDKMFNKDSMYDYMLDKIKLLS